jgi:hypothetical protein
VRSTDVLRATALLASFFAASFEFNQLVFPDWQPGVLPVNESRECFGSELNRRHPDLQPSALRV